MHWALYPPILCGPADFDCALASAFFGATARTIIPELYNSNRPSKYGFLELIPDSSSSFLGKAELPDCPFFYLILSAIMADE